MTALRRRIWIRRSGRACTVVGLCLILASLMSVFLAPIYQQPPGAWMPPPGSVKPGGSYTEPPGTPPAGRIRARFLAGSLIISNGHLPPAKSHVGMTTLGFMYKAGLTWFTNSPSIAWQVLSTRSTWEWYFYKEHVQVQLFPIGLVLLVPWALRRWVFKERPEWACQACGYDLRGKPEGPCPECGVATGKVGF